MKIPILLRIRPTVGRLLAFEFHLEKVTHNLNGSLLLGSKSRQSRPIPVSAGRLANAFGHLKVGERFKVDRLKRRRNLRAVLESVERWISALAFDRTAVKILS